MYVHTISYGTACMCGIYLYPASLTSSFALMSAPILRRSATVSVWPLKAALCNAVFPKSYNNRETETERDRSGQGHTDTDRHTDTDTDTVRTEGRRIDLTQR